MKKQYIIPVTDLIPGKEIPDLLAGSEQPPWAGGKESEFNFDSDDSNPWKSEKDEDFTPWK